MIICPQCGFEQDSIRESCHLCGLNFAKHQQRILDATAKPKSTEQSSSSTKLKQKKSWFHRPNDNLVKRGGRVDVAASIMNQAEKVSARDLMEMGEEVVTLDMAVITQLIHEAVDQAVSEAERTSTTLERERLLLEAESKFQKRLNNFNNEKKAVDQEVGSLKNQLEEVNRQLTQERAKLLDDETFSVSSSGLEALHDSFTKWLNQALNAGTVDKDLEKSLKDIVNRVLDDERARLLLKEKELRDDAVTLLENKVKRLAYMLGEAESARDRAHHYVANLEGRGGLVGSQIMGTDFSVTSPDNNYRLQLMEEVIRRNVELRDLLRSEGRLPLKGKGKEPAKVKSLGSYRDFEPPPLDKKT